MSEIRINTHLVVDDMTRLGTGVREVGIFYGADDAARDILEGAYSLPVAVFRADSEDGVCLNVSAAIARTIRKMAAADGIDLATRPEALAFCEAYPNGPTAWRRVAASLRERWQDGDAWVCDVPGAGRYLVEMGDGRWQAKLDGRALPGLHFSADEAKAAVERLVAALVF